VTTETTYLTVDRDGWPAVRDAVLRRDGGCVANQYRVFGGDLATDECANKWGTPLEGLALDQLELDHVTRHGKRYDDEAHLISVCPRHHRLSRTWRIDSRVHRALCRGYLHRLYPSVWETVVYRESPKETR
jgi:hypothetical protein